MKKLQEIDVIRVMREEWKLRVDAVREAVDVVANACVGDAGELPVLTPGLKVRHKDSQIRYTIHSIGPRDVILKTPEGEKFLVDSGTLENEYQLD
jgi:hypothetical protein